MLINPADFTDAPGTDVSKLLPNEILVILGQAQALCEQFINLGQLEYAAYSEQHSWRGSLTMFLYHNPIRTVTAAKIVNLIQNSVEGGYLIDVTGISINAELGNFQGSNLLLSYGAVPFFSYVNPYLRVSYTAGFDNGTVQADGLSVPAPSWLLDAIWITAQDLCDKWTTRKKIKGLGHLMSSSMAGTHWAMQRDYPNRGKVLSSLPQAARDLLINQDQLLWIGG